MCATPHQFGEGREGKWGPAGHWAACVCAHGKYGSIIRSRARQQVDLLPSALAAAARNTHVWSLQSSCRLL